MYSNSVQYSQNQPLFDPRSIFCLVLPTATDRISTTATTLQFIFHKLADHNMDDINDLVNQMSNHVVNPNPASECAFNQLAAELAGVSIEDNRQTYYDLLGVTPVSGTDHINASYQERIYAIHQGIRRNPAAPDRIQKEAIMKRLREAWNCLSNPERRSRYDRITGLGSGSLVHEEPKQLCNQVSIMTDSGWAFAARISGRFAVVSGSEKKQLESATHLSLAFDLVADPSFIPDSNAESEDVKMWILRTPHSQDVTQVRSLLTYEIFEGFKTDVKLVIDVHIPTQKPSGTSSLTRHTNPLRTPWLLSFDVEPVPLEKLARNAEYRVTHLLFTKSEPSAIDKIFRKLPDYPSTRPERRLKLNDELAPLEVLDLGPQYYQTAVISGQMWHRLAAVGVPMFTAFST